MCGCVAWSVLNQNRERIPPFLPVSENHPIMWVFVSVFGSKVTLTSGNTTLEENTTYYVLIYL